MSPNHPANMAFDINDDLHVIVLGTANPTAKDWEEYTNAISALERKGVDVTRMRTLVFTDSGGPDAAQRAVLVKILRGRKTKLVMLSDSQAFRMIGIAITWFNDFAKVLSPSRMIEALTFLGIPETRADAILQLARKLETQLKFKCKALEAAFDARRDLHP